MFSGYFKSIILASAYSPTPIRGSTIGDEWLNFCVRDGNRCTPLSIDTKMMLLNITEQLKNNISSNYWLKSSPLSLKIRKLGEGTITIDKKVSRSISTSQLNPLRDLHLMPINEVVYFGPNGENFLENGFPLRCFQRLSQPDIATQQCP